MPAGAFTAELLTALLSAVGADMDVLDALTGLCDRSLLTVHERGTPTRYRMLEILREFGRHRREEAGLETLVRAAHADAVEAIISASDRTTTFTWDVDLDLQRRWLPEARMALRWRAEQDDRRGVQRLAAKLGWLWLLTALPHEGLRWLDRGLGRIEEIDLEEVEPDAVLWAASLRINEAPQDDGLRWAQLAADAAREDLQRSVAQVTVAAHRAVSGELADAYAELRHRPTDGSWLEGYWQLLEGQLLAMEGSSAEAERRLARSEQLLLDNGAWWGVWTAATLIQLAQLRGDVARVRQLAERALPVCARRHTAELEVELRCIVAMVANDTGDPRYADEQLAAAQALVDRTGVAMSLALVATATGYLLMRRGLERPAAAAELEAALALHDREGQAFGRPFVLWALGHLALRDGDLTTVRQQQGALADALQRGDSDAVAYTLEGLAAAMTEQGQLTAAARALGAAVNRRARLDAAEAIITSAEFRATDQRLRELLTTPQLAEERRLGASQDDDTLRAVAREAMTLADVILPLTSAPAGINPSPIAGSPSGSSRTSPGAANVGKLRPSRRHHLTSPPATSPPLARRRPRPHHEAPDRLFRVGCSHGHERCSRRGYTRLSVGWFCTRASQACRIRHPGRGVTGNRRQPSPRRVGCRRQRCAGPKVSLLACGEGWR